MVEKSDPTEFVKLSTDDKLVVLLNCFHKLDNKLSDIGTRITTVESTLGDHTGSIKRIDGNLVANENRLVNLETSNATHQKEINELKESATFQSNECEALKLKVGVLEGVKTENVHLKKRVDDLENALMQEKIGRNDEQQYLRQASNIKICGVPAILGEDVQTKTATNPVTLEVVKQLVQQTDMYLPPTAIDVCHRLGNDPVSPILIRFQSKSDRVNFAAQKEKLKNVTSANIDLSGIQIPKSIQTVLDERKKEGRTSSRTPRGGRKPANVSEAPTGPTPIYLQDHLTARNKDLLKEAKTALKTSFKYPGYVMDGEIRAKRACRRRKVICHQVDCIYQSYS